MEIQTLKIKEINPAVYNPRKDLQPGDLEYEKLKKSIEEFDLAEPLIWNKRTGNLVGGHQRLKILKERGDIEVEVSVVDLDETKEKALNLALNRIQGGWEFMGLKAVLNEISSGPVDFDLISTGFDWPEIEALRLDLTILPLDERATQVANYFANVSHGTAYWSVGKIAGVVDIKLLDEVERKLESKLSEHADTSALLNALLEFIGEKW